MSEYKAESQYQVFQLTDSNLSSAGRRIYGLIDTHAKFDDFGDAEQWIQANGERQVDYTILEIYRKK
ncbi:hypothetical protein [Paraflavitalea sp. CAU 1676]|uniref:hypothetical protein n=1 Tax=Paraflavitalea sp. CAU 1676 TaxID=3032598 RepID=UPI0023DC8F8D|nr:hypothetical protein [Paraflavitalea sp. CAU 1676]MDF2189291.1 hypothetical protein [Paraflavitalea sp. CAU 1676]